MSVVEEDRQEKGVGERPPQGLLGGSLSDVRLDVQCHPEAL